MSLGKSGRRGQGSTGKGRAHRTCLRKEVRYCVGWEASELRNDSIWFLKIVLAAEWKIDFGREWVIEFFFRYVIFEISVFKD